MTMQLIWFRMPYIKNMLKPGNVYVFYGKVIAKNKDLAMEQPTIYTAEQYDSVENNLTPVYPLAFGLTNHAVQKAVRQALASDELLKEYLPEELLQKYDLIPYAEAIRQIHFPDDMTHLIVARRRLVFDEFFLFILNMRKQKEITQKEENPFTLVDDDFVEQLIGQLPYPLTGGAEAYTGGDPRGCTRKLCDAASGSGRCRIGKDDRGIPCNGGDGAQRTAVCDHGADGSPCETAL